MRESFDGDYRKKIINISEEDNQIDIGLYDKLDPEESPRVMERVERYLARKRKEDCELPDEQYEKFVEQYSSELRIIVTELLNIWEQPPHRTTLAHDRAHIAHDLLAYVRLVQNEKFSKGEQYMILISSLLHDIGRYPESQKVEQGGVHDIDKGSEMQLHAAFSGHLGGLIAKISRQRSGKQKGSNEEIREASKAFGRRVLGAVLMHGGGPVRDNEARGTVADPIIDLTQDIDKAAGMVGEKYPPRAIVFDLYKRKAVLYPDTSLDYSHEIPSNKNVPAGDFLESHEPEKSPANLLHITEFITRNLYPLTTEYGRKKARELQRESVIFLRLMAGGPESELFKQTFAPELNKSSEGNRGEEFIFPKRPLPEGVFGELNDKENEAMERLKQYDIAELIDIMLQQNSPDILKEDRDSIIQMLIEQSKGHEEDFVQALRYLVARRELNKVDERDDIEKALQSDDPLQQMIAKKLNESGIFKPLLNS